LLCSKTEQDLGSRTLKVKKRTKRRKFIKKIQKKMKGFQHDNLRALNKFEMELFRKIQSEFGLQVIRQYRMGFYFIDILILDRLLAIEVDGSSHDRQSQKIKDERKEKLIRRMGLQIIRIKNEEVSNWDYCRELISSFPIVEDHAKKFQKMHSRNTGYIGFCVGKMARRAI
jgi:very-short-patch-repair endonuclease